TRWNGTGDYIVVLGIADSEGEVEKMFFYSNGAQINSNSTDVPRYSITETTSSIAYNLFYDMTTYMRLSQNFSFGKATLKFAVLQD
ncbi:MAG: hypothetical protein LBB83_07790, partial [Treponema sp.]|nr:hypothetical protein [Treponema sp.]